MSSRKEVDAVIKKFFVAVIISLLVISSQIAVAEDYDWNQAPRFGNKADIARYIERERRQGQKVFPIVLTNFKFSVDKEIAEKERDRLQEEFVNRFAIAPKSYIKFIVMGTGQLVYEITDEYPGTCVANAYRNGNISNLTDEERNLYYEAVKIVKEAKKRPSEIEKARYIHDEICKMAPFPKNNPSNKTAIGALIIGETNCLGYTDAFYMLGRMAGLKVGRIGGTINTGTTGHAWNWITFSNGKSYCIDVTLDNTYNSHDWFLKTKSQMEKTHWCYWEIIPNLQ